LAKAGLNRTLFQDGQRKNFDKKKPLRRAAKLKTKPPTLQKAKIYREKNYLGLPLS
jgi:hypothetical protein